MNKIVLRRCAEYRLYVKNPQTLDATYHLATINMFDGIQRLRVPAPVAAKLTDTDSGAFRDYAAREFLRAQMYNDPWYDEIIFPR
jgi:hypothetical protein